MYTNDKLLHNTTCQAAFAKTNELIERRKKSLNRIPEIQEFDNGNILVQFFNEWETDINKNKRREFDIVGDEYSDKTIVAIFSEKGKVIDENSFGKSKTFMVINGSIDIQFTSEIENTNTTISTFQSLDIPEYLTYKVTCLRDSYIIMISN